MPGRRRHRLQPIKNQIRRLEEMHERLVRYARTLALSAAVAVIASGAARAQKQYDTGVTDTEIKIGNTMPYSGPASAYGIIGKTVTAYFKMINDNGGINGR